MSVPHGVMQAMTWQDKHPRLVDAGIASALLLLSLPLALAPWRADPLTFPPSPWYAVTAITCLLCCLALALRRRLPVLVWLVVTLLACANRVCASWAAGLSLDEANYTYGMLAVVVVVGIPLTLGTLAALRDLRLAVGAYLASTLAQTASESVASYFEGLETLVLVLLPFALVNLVGLLFGTLLRVQRQNLAEAETRSARVLLAREQTAQLAAAAERSRIAREMHDVIAHSLAVMITMADGAAAAVDRNPKMAKEALSVLGDTGRSALADTRRLVGVLREDPAPTTGAGAPANSPRPDQSEPTGGLAAPVVRELPVPEFAPPGTVVPVEPSAPISDLREAAASHQDPSTGGTPLAPAPESGDLEQLVQRFQAAGVPVTYTWEGPALPDDKGLQLTLFRIAQESLTNVLRYAPTTGAVRVTVERHTGTVVLVVDNEAAPGTKAMQGSGKGLIGMRERAAVYGGQVQAGPTPTGWRVRAILRWEERDEGSTKWQMPM